VGAAVSAYRFFRTQPTAEIVYYIALVN